MFERRVPGTWYSMGWDGMSRCPFARFDLTLSSQTLNSSPPVAFSMFRSILILVVSCFTHHVTAETPIYHVKAPNLYQAGLQLGQLASNQIQAWFQLKEFVATQHFVQNTDIGRRAFASFKENNTRVFPELVDEMMGIAKGANVDLDLVWIANLTPELESLMPLELKQREDHCTDLFGHEPKGDYLHGHNEDWSEEVKPLWYFVKLTPSSPSANFTECAGMAYPGTLLGYASTWSKNIYSTQNTLFPNSTLSEGLACTFVQRRATCGHGKDGRVTTLAESVVKLNSVGSWAASASVNVILIGGDRVDTRMTTTTTMTTKATTAAAAAAVHMVNVEAYEDNFSVFSVTPTSHGNYSHMNMFKHLKKGELADRGDVSTSHRQKRIWAMNAPTSVLDVAKILGDIEDPKFPIYRSITLTSTIYSSKTNQLSIWIDSNPHTTLPVFVWDLGSFFD